MNRKLFWDILVAHKNKLLQCLLVAMSCSTSFAATISVGAGSISDRANPVGFTCVNDHGAWISNAGIVEPGIDACDPQSGPLGTPRRLTPHLTGPAASKPTGTHRWWGSVAFYGEMGLGDSSRSGYITPDPISARVTTRGFRMASIPAGLSFKNGIADTYDIPAPLDEVFDGLAIANTAFDELDAKLYDYSDGSVTVEWQHSNQPVMRATFVHASPYVFIEVLQGELILRSKGVTGPEKGIFHQANNQLGIWTEVAGNRGHFLVVGEGDTQFHNINGRSVRVSNTSHRITLALVPTLESVPSVEQIARFVESAAQQIDEVRIDYQVDQSTQKVTVSQRYLNNGQPVDTYAGLMPLQWKNAVDQINSLDSIRSARGFIKFASLSQFKYELPFVGVLPSMPILEQSYESEKLTQLIRNFVSKGPTGWNTHRDTYWSGKNYGKVAEVAALAQQLELTNEHTTLINWLKAELEDWFTASNNGLPNASKYFSYDENWNTLLGYNESFGSQQQLNDHHFHYGYFVRAAAEICRTDKSWCASNAWGGMVEMLIRDYAALRNDTQFPYVRNFDPANGFSWASGHANFVLGNNNESTSEAANAYGAIVLYGMITGNNELVEHGVYLHTLSAATYWEYWNNIDRFRGKAAPYDNFSPQYNKMTTSIIWGGGHVFSTWFSGAYAHILGIQGLPLNPLVMHIGLHADYLEDYVTLGLSESLNGKPSGLANDQWRDVWWNIWAMTNPEAAIADFNSMNFNYDVESGETIPHTYHWLHTLNVLGHIKTGSGQITANSPMAQVYEKNGQRTYVAYNYSNSTKVVKFSDGKSMSVAPNSFGVSGHGGSGGSADDVDDGDDDSSGDNDSGGDDDTNDDDSASCATFCVVVEGNSLLVSAAVGDRVDFHYRIDSGIQQNFAMKFTSGGFQHRIKNLMDGNVIDYYFTVIDNSSAQDTHWKQLIFNRVSNDDQNDDGGDDSDDNDGSGDNSGGDNNDDGNNDDPYDDSACDDFCLTEQGNQLIVVAGVGERSDFHYRINNGTQLNVRMVPIGNHHHYRIENLNQGDNVSYFFTVINQQSAYDTVVKNYVFGQSSGASERLSIVSATASSQMQSAAFAIDNDLDTRWESIHTNNGQWLTLDLGQSRIIRNIKLNWEAANAKIYEIWMSNNGTDWWYVDKRANGVFGNRIDTLELEQNARYVTIVMKERSNGNFWGYSLFNLDIYGE